MIRPTLTPEARAAQLALMRERVQVDGDDFLWWLDQKQWTWQQVERGEYGLSLEEIQLLYVMEDPVLWGRAFLMDPDTGKPWELFDYQLPSARAWHQDVVHQDGAEVGKTREIVLLLLWGANTGNGGSVRNPWFLVGAPQQTHLDEIIMAIEEHCGVDDEERGQHNVLKYFWRRPKKTPHYLMRFWGAAGRSRIYFRPAGHDGEAFRGVHVNAGGFMDEAAKIKAKVCWTEFYRALKPGARLRVYSVPDGDNSTDYYRMTQQAKSTLKPGEAGMRGFHWQKPQMPAPFWSVERKAEMVRRYGGEDTPGYQRNVLGLHGQQENPVWSWELLMRNVRDVPEYRCLRLLCNEQSGELHRIVSRVDLHQAEGKKHGEEHVLVDAYAPLAPFLSKDRAAIRAEIESILREAFEPLGDGLYWFGADLGFSKDPTEMVLYHQVGEQLRKVARIHAKGVSYDLQCELIHGLDKLFGFQAELGVDFGSAGTAVVQMLQRLEDYADGRYEDRLTGFNFAGAVDVIDEEGEAATVLDEDDGEAEEVRIPAKELATNLITARLQRADFAEPYDAEVLDHYANHTAREGAKHRIFAKVNDHTIDADRVMMLRKAFSSRIAVADVFASGVQQRHAA